MRISGEYQYPMWRLIKVMRRPACMRPLLRLIYNKMPNTDESREDRMERQRDGEMEGQRDGEMMERWRDGETEERREGGMERRRNGETEGRREGGMEGQRDGETEGWREDGERMETEGWRDRGMEGGGGAWVRGGLPALLLPHFSSSLISSCHAETPSDYLFSLLLAEAITTNRPAGCCERLGVINQWVV